MARRRFNAKQTGCFAIYAPNGAQQALLDLPVVRRRLLAERRAMICDCVKVMKRAGLSQNRIADFFGIHRSALSAWLHSYEVGGLAALVPKPMGRRPASGQDTPCTLTIAMI